MGRPSKVSQASIVAASIAIADEHGLRPHYGSQSQSASP